MKAFVFERTGNPNDVLAVRELPEPKPGPGEILVRVRLSPVHPSDMHIMRGRFGRQPTLPASPGIECVGVVERLDRRCRSCTWHARRSSERLGFVA